MNLGRVDKAQELLSLPWTNVNAQYANGNTPLILAVQGNNQTYPFLIAMECFLNEVNESNNLFFINQETAKD